MMEQQNPYQAPAVRSPLESKFRSTVPPDIAFVGKVQFCLRLVGVYFLVDGIAGFVGSVVYWVAQSYVWQQAGYSAEVDPYALMWLTSSGLALLGGLYLVIGGEWVIEKIFLPSSYRHSRGNQELPEESEKLPG